MPKGGNDGSPRIAVIAAVVMMGLLGGAAYLIAVGDALAHLSGSVVIAVYAVLAGLFAREVWSTFGRKQRERLRRCLLTSFFSFVAIAAFVAAFLAVSALAQWLALLSVIIGELSVLAAIAAYGGRDRKISPNDTR